MVEIRKKTGSEWVVIIKKASRFKCILEESNTPNEQATPQISYSILVFVYIKKGKRKTV